MTIRRTSAGFTLIEVTVALMLMAMVLTFVYESFALTMRTKQAVEKRADRYQSARIAMQRMEHELQSAYLEPAATAPGAVNGQPPQVPQPPAQPGLTPSTPGLAGESKPHTGMHGISQEADGFPRDRLDFTTLAHYAIAAAGPDDHQSDHEEVGYFTETDYKEQRTDLMHREDFTLDDDPTGGGDVFPLMESVKGLNFRYLDPNTKNWTEEWNSDEKHGLPAAVEVTLYLDNPADSSKPLYFSKVVRMPLSQPASLNQQVQVANTGKGSPYDKVLQNKQTQLQRVFGGDHPTEQNPTVISQPGLFTPPPP